MLDLGRHDALVEIEVNVHERADVAIVQPTGELDLATVGRLQAALDEIEQPEALVLDLSGLSFIDSTGLCLLVGLHQRAQRDGFDLRLVMPPAPASRAIEVCGLADTLPFAAPEEALDHDLRSNSPASR